MLKESRYDALILDIMMPGIDGFQVGRSARRESQNRDIPIVLLTAHPYALKEYDARWLQPVASLTKPARLDKLVKALRKSSEK
jgi:CheY-like chemotaxis protein